MIKYAIASMVVGFLALCGCSSEETGPCAGESCGAGGSGGSSTASSAPGGGGVGGGANSGSSSSSSSSASSADSSSSSGVVDTCDPNPTTGELPCEVERVLVQRCQSCHNPADLADSGAPFSLVTYADTQAPFGISGEPRWHRMQEVTTPGSGTPMPPSKPLTAAERDVLAAWFAACAPPREVGVTCP